ncbi:hypothetical protein PTTG_25647, partial [Puccinia triticina 1-1 BBBD Race 1]
GLQGGGRTKPDPPPFNNIQRPLLKLTANWWVLYPSLLTTAQSITTSAQFFIQPNLSQLHPRFTPQSVNPWRLIPQPFHHTHLVAVRLVRTTTARYNQPGRPYAKQNDGSVNFRPTRSHLLFTSAPPSITTALTPQSVDPWRLKPQSHHQTHHVVVCLVRATPARYTSKFRPTRPAYRPHNDKSS